MPRSGWRLARNACLAIALLAAAAAAFLAAGGAGTPPCPSSGFPGPGSCAFEAGGALLASVGVLGAALAGAALAAGLARRRPG